MNNEELELWKTGVSEHLDALSVLINDRKILKELIEKHLAKFFTWDNVRRIEYNKDFTKITLEYKHDVGAVIKPELMSDLGMDWIVSPSYDDKAFKIIKIEVYPFGLPKEGEIVEE